MTKTEAIQGMIINGLAPSMKMITVRFTSDESGETISLADENNGIMLLVPFEPVQELIDEARKIGQH